jgi:hypothetical protein
MLPIKKIYIDSRFKSSDSASNSDFKIDLPATLLMPEDTGFYIDDVCIPHTWYPIEDGKNDLVAFRLNGVNMFAYVPAGNYSVKDLGVAIVSSMNAILTSVGQVPRFESVYNVITSTITIKLLDSQKASNIFQIYTDALLKELAPSLVSRSMNTLLKNFTSQGNSNSDFVSGYIDMYPLRNIYMTCSGLGNFNTMSVSGDRNIIKKVPVNAGHGEVIFDQTVTGMDYLDCSHQTLSRISFQLKDVFGNIIDLHDNHISFSIVFSRVQNGI